MRDEDGSDRSGIPIELSPSGLRRGGGKRRGDGFGFFLDDSEQHARRAFRPALALFPIPHGAELQAKAHGKRLTGEPHFAPNLQDIDVSRHMDPIGGGIGVTLRYRDGVGEPPPRFYRMPSCS
jgi:hypothetical protein